MPIKKILKGVWYLELWTVIWNIDDNFKIKVSCWRHHSWDPSPPHVIKCQHMVNPLPPLKNADILYGRSLSINHVIHQPTAENLKTWTSGVSLINLKRDNQFYFFAIQDAEDEEDDDDKKKDGKDKDKKKDGKDGKGLAHHMFSRFLNLRICFTKIYLFCFFTR